MIRRISGIEETNQKYKTSSQYLTTFHICRSLMLPPTHIQIKQHPLQGFEVWLNEGINKAMNVA